MLTLISRRSLAALVVAVLFAASANMLSAEACGKKSAEPAPTKDEASAFLAVPATAAAANASISQDDRTLVQNYVKSQVAAYNLTMPQFAALTPAQQTAILAPGRQFVLSREARRAIVPKSNMVPSSVSDQLTPNGTISQAVIDTYAVTLPKTVALTLDAPAGYSRLIIGDKLVLVSPDGVIADVVSDIY
ncbi:MAG: hypothetical protein AB7P76_04195 [Candidatus Melainabacteria bacterium]